MKLLKKFMKLYENLMKFGGSTLIRIGNDTRPFGERILDMRFCVQDYFILHLFIDDEKIYPPNFRS